MFVLFSRIRYDVDYTNSIIEINETKGFDQHRVVGLIITSDRYGQR